MDIKEILKKDFAKALETLTADPKEKDKDIQANRDAYNGKHAILSDPLRATKTVGDSSENTRTVKHTKEIIPFQRRIVNSAVTFLFGEPVTLILNDDNADAYDAIAAVWKQNKLDYFNKKLARDLFVECKVAELWYVPAEEIKGQPARIRVALLSNREGYKIYPHFSDTGDMDAFTVLYDSLDDNGKTQENVNIYTAEQIVRATKKSGGQWESTTGANLIGKIPIVYYEQDVPEWDGVETQIDRMEYLISNFADTNDYFAAPALELKGIVTNLPKKEDTGKVFMVQPETDAEGKVYYPGGIEFKAWANAPDAIKLEMDSLKDIVYSMTSTPDLSFSNVKGLSNLSGISIRLMFSDALFKAKDKQEVFGPAMERRLSIMKSIIAITDRSKAAQLADVDIDVVFNDVLPQDTLALIQSLSVARGGEAIMSEESAVRMNPLVTDAEKDIEILAGEKSQIQSFAGSYI